MRLPATVLIAAVCVVGMADEIREWTAGNFSERGSFVSLDGDVVTIRLVSGDEVEVGLSSLSADDQAYAKAKHAGTKSPFRPKRPGEPGIATAGAVMINSLGMKLVKIPAGEFDMGSDDFKDEQPVHRVRITKPFLMGQTEVTLGQFLEFYRAGPEGRLTSQKPRRLSVGYDPIMRTFKHRRENLPWDWGHPDMDVKTPAGKVKAFRYPVVNVSWGDCVAFCEWLSLKERERYRLPTEAEWEYACRAGKTTRFWTGDDPESLTPCENVCDPTIAERVIDKDDRERAFALESRDGHALSAPVGSYGQLNPFGLADMHGNVSEWCSDWYDAGYYPQSPPADPKGAAGGVYRVIRGGSWLSHPAGCRSAYRRILQKDSDKTYYPEYALTVGFRVVRDVD